MTRTIPITSCNLAYGIWYIVTGLMLFVLLYTTIAVITYHSESFEEPMLNCKMITDGSICISDPVKKITAFHDCWTDLIQMNKQCHSVVLGGYYWENPPRFSLFLQLDIIYNVLNGIVLFIKLNQKYRWFQLKKEMSTSC